MPLRSPPVYLLLVLASLCWRTLQVGQTPCEHDAALCRVVSEFCVCIPDPTSYSGNIFTVEKWCAVLSVGDLASIHSEQENNIFRDMMDSQNVTKGVWIGLSKNGGSYYWGDGTPLTYQNFANNSRGGKNKDCYMMSAEDGAWRPKNCYNGEFAVACMTFYSSTMKPTTTQVTTTTPTPSKHLSALYIALIVVVSVVCVLLVIGVGLVIAAVKRRRRANEMEDYSSLPENMENSNH